MMVVYGDGARKLWYQVVSDRVQNTPEQIASDVDPGVRPALVPSGPGAGLRLYYAKKGKLYSSDYLNRYAYQTGEKPELDRYGEHIRAGAGISVVKGYETAVSGPSWYAMTAVPPGQGREIDPVTGDTDVYNIEFWRYNAKADRWSQVNEGVDFETSNTAVSLAYVPFSKSDITQGQFYFGYRNWSGEMRIRKTEGNDSRPGASVRRLQWQRSIMLYNSFSQSDDGPALLYDLEFDDNLRATWGFINGRTNTRDIWFHPVADGIANITLTDQDDFHFMRETLDCSLGIRSGCIKL
jgi:hypothetical protein